MYVGDPHFAAVKHITTLYFLGCCSHTDDVGACRDFGHGKCSDIFAGDDARQVTLFLGGCAV